MARWWLRYGRAGAPALALLLALAGCGGEDPRAHARRPADAGACNDLPFIHGDPGALVGTHWSSDRHAWGDRVAVYSCTDPKLQGSVRLGASGHGIEVTPPEASLEGSGSGIHRFEVTVARGASGELWMQVETTGGGFHATTTGPHVEADGEGWRFAEGRS